ncbi:MAG: redoxin domain-containing protein [bacterium]|nr:redoxin domain-containing protein [bacterium]MDI1335128.1 redoxin domain-containing protein [Lacunisphaera sp.]
MPKSPLFLRCLVAAWGLALAGPLVAADKGAHDWWTNQDVRGLEGAPVAVTGRWIVLVFLSPECPLANASVPLLNKLAEEYGPRGFTFVGVYADPTAGRPVLRQHAKDYGLVFSTTDDREHRLVRLTAATYTPEVFVFAADGNRLYRGRIDDRVGDFGAARPTATRQDLREVLAALVSGKSGPFPDRPGFGCAIPEAVKP